MEPITVVQNYITLTGLATELISQNPHKPTTLCVYSKPRLGRLFADLQTNLRFGLWPQLVRLRIRSTELELHISGLIHLQSS